MKKIIDKVLSSVLVFLMSVMVIDVLWQVFSRYVLLDPSSFTDELARYLLIWIGVLGAAYAAGQRHHLSINILPTKLNETNRVRLRIFLNILIIGFAFFALFIGGSRLVYITYVLGQHSPALNVPLFVVYLIIPVSGIIVVLYKFLEILNPKSLAHDN